MSKINKELVVEQLIKDCKTPEDFFGENGLIKSFVKTVMESALNGLCCINNEKIYILINELLKISIYKNSNNFKRLRYLCNKV